MKKTINSDKNKENKRYKSKEICPRCKNRLHYWISNDYYFKGKRFYECIVCDWTPEDVKPKLHYHEQGIVCSECD